LKARFSDRRLLAELRLGADQGRLRSRLHALGAITDESMDEHGWLLQIDMPLATAERLATEAGGHLLAPLLVTPIAPTYNLDND